MAFASQPGSGDARVNGLGDVVTTAFFSPAKSGRLIWGAGPVFLLPTATSNALGSTLADLVVNGVRLTSGDGTVAPNTRVALPGVGYVVLNEQLPSGDGVHSSGLTVNLIHVVLQNALTGTRTGEIVVGSATSSATL